MVLAWSRSSWVAQAAESGVVLEKVGPHPLDVQLTQMRYPLSGLLSAGQLPVRVNWTQHGRRRKASTTSGTLVWRPKLLNDKKNQDPLRFCVPCVVFRCFVVSVFLLIPVGNYLFVCKGHITFFYFLRSLGTSPHNTVPPPLAPGRQSIDLVESGLRDVLVRNQRLEVIIEPSGLFCLPPHPVR